jgi:hypothetical protein
MKVVKLMKSTHTKHTKKQPPRPYPKLMISSNMVSIDNDVIVLMQEEGKGIIVYVTSNDWYRRRVGEYYQDWCMESFEEYTGKVTIQN